MSATRCATKDCPWPTNEEIHVPWCRAIVGHTCFGGATHQHLPKKGMGGNNPDSKIRAIICAGIHDSCDNGTTIDGRRYGNDYMTPSWALGNEREFEGCEFYRIFDRDFDHTPEGHDLLFRSTPPDEHGNEKVRVTLAPAMPSGVDDVPPDRLGVALLPEPGPPDGHRLETDGWNDWLDQGAMLGGTERNIPWAVGDWVVWGEERFGEQAAQGYDTLGLTLGAINQPAWVAKRFTPNTRVKELSWSHHRAVSALESHEEMRSWLIKARDEGLSVAALREAMGLTKPRVKRWSMVDLREAADLWDRLDGADSVDAFLAWLEGQA